MNAICIQVSFTHDILTELAQKHSRLTQITAAYNMMQNNTQTARFQKISNHVEISTIFKSRPQPRERFNRLNQLVQGLNNISTPVAKTIMRNIDTTPFKGKGAANTPVTTPSKGKSKVPVWDTFKAFKEAQGPHRWQ